MEQREFFKRVTGCNPYDFQVELMHKLHEGRNVILQAPTGSGKTWASIVPFLYAWEMQIPFPRKLIYSLPLRTLTNSLYETVRGNEYVKNLESHVFEEHPYRKANDSLKKNSESFVRIQTGENTGDSFFEGEIIFTTIDQSLSSVLEFPLSLPHKLANINAGAMVGAYLVFDEFHLFDTNRAFATTINILKKLNGIAPFCLMTATVSKELLEKLAEELNADVVQVKDAELKSINSQKTTKTLFTSRSPLSAEKILEKHKSKSIVICNTVERCQEIVNELRTNKSQETELICIHSRFFGKHRKEKEERIKRLFDKESTANVILVSTQVVEVGLDITSDVMHTEVSPINSFFQRIGRCARYENEQGEIYVYLPKPNEKGETHFYPYESDESRGTKAICIKTFDELEKLNGQTLTYRKTEELITLILAERDLKDFKALQADGFNNRTILNAFQDKKKGYSGELIREVNAKSIALSLNYQKIKSPYDYETVSIGFYTLKKHLKHITESVHYEQDEDWVVAKIGMNNQIGFEEIEGDYQLQLFKSSLDDVKHEPLFFLNSKFANYDEEIGLNFMRIGSTESQLKIKSQRIHEYKLQKDTYRQHIEAMIECYRVQFQEQYRYTFDRIRHRLNAELDFDELVRFMIVMHDYGKLNEKWQRIVHQYQSQKPDYKPEEILAHTDFDYSDADRAAMQKLGKLPPHAGVGALISIVILEQLIQNEKLAERICTAVATSIIEHHTVNAETTGAYHVAEKERNHAFTLINAFAKSFSGFDNTGVLFKESNEQNIKDLLVQRSDDEQLILYLILARILRLCDQKSFSYIQKKN